LRPNERRFSLVRPDANVVWTGVSRVDQGQAQACRRGPLQRISVRGREADLKVTEPGLLGTYFPGGSSRMAQGATRPRLRENGRDGKERLNRRSFDARENCG